MLRSNRLQEALRKIKEVAILNKIILRKKIGKLSDCTRFKGVYLVKEWIDSKVESRNAKITRRWIRCCRELYIYFNIKGNQTRLRIAKNKGKKRSW